VHALLIRSVMCLAVGLVSAAGAAGCGSEIGDACSLSSDCSNSGDRICDTLSEGGYCTVFGCDHDTCPEESECVRFFAGVATNLPCDPATEDVSTDDCSADELCSLTENCVPRSAEIRYCMRLCDTQDDCREGYECRTEDLMREHGGEPVPPPGESVLDNIAAFCAEAPN
jgi:hypothetical protein